MKHLILFSLFVYLALSATCALNYGSCNNCQADGCDYCDETGFGFFSCKDKGSCAATANITAEGQCAPACADYKTCSKCQTLGKDLGCSYCTTSGIGSCMTSCTAPYTTVDVCPKVCDTVPAATTGNLCNYPATYKIPSNESNPILFQSCWNNALGYGPVSNATANCTDKCTLEQAKLSSDCINAVLKVSCSAICPTCDDDFSLLSFLNYFPCKSLCDDAHTKCNSQLSDECKLNLTASCSTASTCNPGTDVTGNKGSGSDCGGGESSSDAGSSNAGSSDAGSSDAGSSNGASSNGGSSNGASSNGGSSNGASSATSKTTSATSTSGSAAIVACVILAVVALLI